MTVVVGLGANLGDPQAALADAIAGIAATPGVELRAVSHAYATTPVGGPPQPDYLNAAVGLAVAIAPLAMLARLQELEAAAGRTRGERFGPRTLDLDLLLWDAVAIDEPGLEVPHPRLVERRFALEPLLELAPAARLPDGRALRAICDALPPQGVRCLRRPLAGLATMTGTGAGSESAS